MPYRSRGLSPRSQSPRRRSEWFAGVGGTAVTVITSSVSAILGNGVVTTFGEETLVRTRGLVDLFLTSSTSPGDGFFGALGIGLVSTPAFAAGAGSIPTPIQEIDWDGWLWYSHFSVHEDSADGQGSGAAHQRIILDSKAMRKVQEQETLVAVIEAIEIGTAVMSVFFDSRMLSKLP